MTNVLPVLVVVLVLAFGVSRRIRPQPVRPAGLIVGAAVIVVLVAVAATVSGGAFFADALALELAPVALVVGGMVGLVLVGTMRFWVDEASGELWMAGGWAFATVLVLTIALRVGIRMLAVAGQQSGASATNGLLADLSSDLLLVSVGMWVTRAALLYRRWRQHQARAATVDC